MTAELAARWHHRDHMDRVEKLADETVVPDGNVGQLNVPTLQPRHEARAAVFNDPDLHARVPLPVARQKSSKDSIDHRRCRADCDDTRVARPQGARTLAKRVRFRENATAAPQQILTI